MRPASSTGNPTAPCVRPVGDLQAPVDAAPWSKAQVACMGHKGATPLMFTIPVEEWTPEQFDHGRAEEPATHLTLEVQRAQYARQRHATRTKAGNMLSRLQQTGCVPSQASTDEAAAAAEAAVLVAQRDFAGNSECLLQSRHKTRYCVGHVPQQGKAPLQKSELQDNCESNVRLQPSLKANLISCVVDTVYACVPQCLCCARVSHAPVAKSDRPAGRGPP